MTNDAQPQNKSLEQTPQATSAPDTIPSPQTAETETASVQPAETQPESETSAATEAEALTSPSAPAPIEADAQQKAEAEKAAREKAELDREIAEALGDQSVEDLVDESVAQETAKQNDTAETRPEKKAAKPEPTIHHDMRRGRISAIRGDDVFVDLTGDKMQGIVPLTQFDRQPRVGSIMDFVVDRVDNEQGLVFLSREGAVSRATWEQLQSGAVVEARVIASNKGGLDLEMVGGIRAFMPASQVDMKHIDNFDKFIGERLQAVVQEIDRKSKRVVLSRRQYLEMQRERAKEQAFEKLSPEQVLQGTVTSVVDFGAFVDLGGVDGLVHVSDLSHQHVKKPSDVVKVGDQVEVKILKIDPEKGRISLGMKQVQPDPWVQAAADIKPGENLSGRVVRTANFGAFVEVSPGVEGLLPLSEMSWKRIGRAEEVCKEGDIVHVQVLNFDPGNHKITLSLKQAQGDPWADAEAKFPRHGLVTGKVLSTTDFGAFVEIETGVEGLVHISELSDRRVGQVTDILQVGDEKEFRIIEIDPEQRRIKLSLKQVTEVAESSDAMMTQASNKPGASKRRKHKKGDLKSGLGNAGGMGMGLGDLKL